jgi:hypothetical protein
MLGMTNVRPLAKPKAPQTGSKSAAAPKPKAGLSRSARYAELSDKLLSAAEIGAEGILTLIREGAIKGRDLAVTVGILLDKVAMLEQRQEPVNATVGELKDKVSMLVAAKQELDRREAEASRQAEAVHPAGAVVPSPASRHPLQ